MGKERLCCQSTIRAAGSAVLQIMKVTGIAFLCVIGFCTLAFADRPVFEGYATADIQGYEFPKDLQEIAGAQLFKLVYEPLDDLGRPGAVSCIITKESVSGQKRESMKSITPPGFVQARYPFIEHEYLYERCHLVGSQFKLDTEIPENIVTGTHFMNLYGMYTVENQIAAYVLTTGNSVYYNVMPDYQEDEIVCRGIIIAAASLSSPGDFSLAKYCFNVQPGVLIDYATGYSTLAETAGKVDTPWDSYEGSLRTGEQDYILNTKSLKFHYPSCSGVASMKENNKQEYHGSRENLINLGYSPCGTCKP